MKILVTGGTGFIGSAVVCSIINDTQDSLINGLCCVIRGN